MRRSLLFAAPFAAFAGVIALALSVAPAERWPIIDATIRGLKVVALFGCLVGALAFPPGTRMFRSFGRFAGAYAILVVRDAVLHRNLVIDVDTTAARWIELVLIVAANGLAASGAWVMARTGAASGLPLPGTAASRSALRAIAIGVAIAITMPTLWLEGSAAVTEGGPKPLMGLTNALGDAVTISLIAPALLTALALGDAPVSQAWTLLTWSLAGWLCYDATFSISGRVPGYGEELRVLAEGFRGLATIGAAAAGIALATSANDPAT
jgi:hypothetical protein